MGKRYDSSKRRQAAEETRQGILKAALKLHWEGITEYEPLAREAGCSLPTLRKNYPTKESLFHDCTRTFGETLRLPDIEALGAIADPQTRLQQGVSELCRIHEAMFGYAWHCSYLRKDSPTLEAEMIAYEGLADAIAEALTTSESAGFAVIRGLLDFLTYRALRLSGRLSPQDASAALIAILEPLFRIDVSTPRSTSLQKGT